MTSANTLVLNTTLQAAKADIKTVLAAQKTEALRFAGSSRKRTYIVAQHLLGLGRILLTEENRPEFASLLMLNKITARAGANDWAYVIELAIPDDKTWKNRAGALRALNHFCAANETDQAAKFIDAFTIQQVKKAGSDEALAEAIGDSQAARLDGLALIDRLQNRKPGEPTEADFILTAKAAEVLDLEALTVADPKVEFLLVWAQVVEGKVLPMAVVEGGEAQAKKAAIATGKLLHSKPSEEEVKDAIDRKVGDIGRCAPRLR